MCLDKYKKDNIYITTGMSIENYFMLELETKIPEELHRLVANSENLKF